jgi:hypothetical protein
VLSRDEEIRALSVERRCLEEPLQGPSGTTIEQSLLPIEWDHVTLWEASEAANRWYPVLIGSRGDPETRKREGH